MTNRPTDLIDVVPCGFASFTDAGAIVFVNRTLCTLLNYEPEELIGRQFEQLLSVPARIFYQTHFFPLLKLHGKADEIYFTLRNKSGDSVPVFANAVRGEFEDKPANHTVFLPLYQRERYEYELINAKRAAEEASRVAEEANRAKSAFLAMMSHEIRTPINAIMGYAQLLEIELGNKLSKKQWSFIEGIQHGSDHLLSLINDILDLAKIESGSMTVANESLPLESALERAVALTEPLAAARGVTLHKNCTQRLTYRGDEDRAAQILINLLSNAVKFTQPGGHIKVDCGVRETNGEQRIFVTVSDTGVGIAPADLGRVFEPFVQVNSGLTRTAKGTGLGLTISRRFALLMHGDLTTVSELGKGSAFTLWLRPS